MSDDKRTLEEWDAEAKRRAEEASGGLKLIELARKRLPSLPETVYAWARDILRFQSQPRCWFNGDVGAVIRLVADQRMEKVWELFLLRRVNPLEALEYCQLAVTTPYEWTCDSLVIAKRRRLEKIADLCVSLESLLKEPPFHIETITDLLTIADELLPVGVRCITMIMWGKDPVETEDRNQLRNWAGEPSLDELIIEPDTPFIGSGLRAVRDYCYLALEASQQRLPRKIAQPSARRTYVSRQLSKLMRRMFNQPYHEYVATTVAVALDLSEEGSECIDGDFVRKVTADP